MDRQTDVMELMGIYDFFLNTKVDDVCFQAKASSGLQSIFYLLLKPNLR
jgi:hypothetical protein